MPKILGHHHLSMLTKNAKENNYFYKHILGLRRVKLTVNQDDPSMYHIFYGDFTGSPGTELTFFEMPFAGRTYRGTNAITQIGLVVPSVDSLLYWQQRFAQFGVLAGEMTTYHGYPALPFEDNEGLRFMFIATDVALSTWQHWADSLVPSMHQIRGIGPVEITVKQPEKFANTLRLLQYTERENADELFVFEAVEDQIFSEIVIKQQDLPSERAGRGSVHHIAIRVANIDELKYWQQRIEAHHFQTSGIIDRHYFASLYFRESNGVLFELATDGPGFTVDSDSATLGENLALPPFLESKRQEIEAQLQPIEEV